MELVKKLQGARVILKDDDEVETVWIGPVGLEFVTNLKGPDPIAYYPTHEGMLSVIVHRDYQKGYKGWMAVLLPMQGRALLTPPNGILFVIPAREVKGIDDPFRDSAKKLERMIEDMEDALARAKK